MGSNSLSVSDKKLFAPELGAFVAKNIALFRYLSEGTEDQLLASFVLDPIRDPNQIDQVLEKLGRCEDAKILFGVPTIYRRLFPVHILLEMKTFADQNPNLVDESTKHVLSISLRQ